MFLIIRSSSVLNEAFPGASFDFQVWLSESVLARLHFIIRVPPGEMPSYDAKELEAKLATVTRSWNDELHDMLLELHGEEEGKRIIRRPGLPTKVVLPPRPTRTSRSRRMVHSPSGVPTQTTPAESSWRLTSPAPDVPPSNARLVNRPPRKRTTCPCSVVSHSAPSRTSVTAVIRLLGSSSEFAELYTVNRTPSKRTSPSKVAAQM